MKQFEIFDMKNVAADPIRDALATAALHLYLQGGTMMDVQSPMNGTARYELNSDWDNGTVITLTALWPVGFNSVEKPIIAVRLAKQSQPYPYSAYRDLHYGISIAQTLDNNKHLERTRVAPMFSPGLFKRRKQRQSAGQMAERLVHDFPPSETSSHALLLPFDFEG